MPEEQEPQIEEQSTDSCSSPFKFKNEMGFRSVDWKALIPPQFIYIRNSNKEDIVSDEEMESVDDQQKLVKLEGYRFLAEVRGFTKNKSKVLRLDDETCTIQNTIKWGGYSYGGLVFNKVETSATVSVCKRELGEMFKDHLVSIAENRAFCRNVRAFLRIPILSEDEVVVNAVEQAKPQNESSENVADPKKKMRLLMKEKGLENFADFKAKMVELEISGADEWADMRSVKNPMLVLRINSALSKL